MSNPESESVGLDHHETHGWLHETLYPISMLFGRGAMARAVTDLAALSASDVVVDVGCGPGSAVRRARRAGAHVVGVDPSPQMLRLARRITSALRMDGITFAEGTAERLPLDPAGATVLWAIQSVHHWEDRNRGIEESLRVLAPGGRMVLAERRVTPGARGHAAHGLTDAQASELAREAAQAGFAEVQTHRVAAGHRTLVAVTALAPGTRPDERPSRPG
jgi:SAM-dependent methyltransferase